MQLESHVPGDHPRPLPPPAPPRAARAVRRRGAPREPDLRRRGDRARAAGRPRRRSRSSDVSYEGLGCSITQACASVMTDLVTGRPLDEALVTQEEFLALMQGRGEPVEADEDLLEDAVAFAGVAKFPARVKCALLGLDGVQGRGARAAGRTADERGTRMTETTTEAAIARRRHRGDARRRRPRARHQRRRPRARLRRHRRPEPRRRPRHDADQRRLPADRRDRGPDPLGARATWSTTSGSTGSGCRRGARTRSPTTAASSCAPSASTSEPAPVPRRRCTTARRSRSATPDGAVRPADRGAGRRRARAGAAGAERRCRRRLVRAEPAGTGSSRSSRAWRCWRSAGRSGPCGPRRRRAAAVPRRRLRRRSASVDRDHGLTRAVGWRAASRVATRRRGMSCTWSPDASPRGSAAPADSSPAAVERHRGLGRLGARSSARCAGPGRGGPACTHCGFWSAGAGACSCSRRQSRSTQPLALADSDRRHDAVRGLPQPVHPAPGEPVTPSLAVREAMDTGDLLVSRWHDVADHPRVDVVLERALRSEP